jgi:Winged helix DNA-binding domain
VSVDVAARRLVNQQIATPRFSSVLELVRWMGAVQAQDYRGGIWATGLRLDGVDAARVEAAIAARQIVRTWPMRGTLHFVPAEDARWMLDLLASRVDAGAAGRYLALGLDKAAFTRGERLIVRALEGGRSLTRPEAYALLERGGVAPHAQRGLHVLFHLSHVGRICQGPRRERQPTFVLLEEWIRKSRSPTREEAFATLATRYFSSHGPATLPDFVWWSGLRVNDARLAIAAAGAQLTKESWDGRDWWSGPRTRARRSRRAAAVLLPPWDEYIVAYKDRRAATGHLSSRAEESLRTVGSSLVLIDGRVRGAWRVTARARSARFNAEYWTAVTRAEKVAVREAARRYGRFFGLELEG